MLTSMNNQYVDLQKTEKDNVKSLKKEDTHEADEIKDDGNTQT